MIRPFHRPSGEFYGVARPEPRRQEDTVLADHAARLLIRSAWQGIQGSKSADPDHGRAFVLQTHWNFAAEAGVSILWELA